MSQIQAKETRAKWALQKFQSSMTLLRVGLVAQLRLERTV